MSFFTSGITGGPVSGPGLVARHSIHLLVGRLHLCSDVPHTAIVATPPNLKPYWILRKKVALRWDDSINTHIIYIYRERHIHRIVYVHVYIYINVYIMCIYIYTRNAWALPRRLLEVSHSQTNANIVATLNSYGKNTWGIREYATPTTVNLEFLREKQFGH